MSRMFVDFLSKSESSIVLFSYYALVQNYQIKQAKEKTSIQFASIQFTLNQTSKIVTKIVFWLDKQQIAYLKKSSLQ